MLAGRVNDFSFSIKDPLLTRLLDLNGLPAPLPGLVIFSFICQTSIVTCFRHHASSAFLNLPGLVCERHLVRECDRKRLAGKDRSAGSISAYRGAIIRRAIPHKLGCSPIFKVSNDRHPAVVFVTGLFSFFYLEEIV